MNEIISKVDITPLVGVALILVIVFMVTSPMISTPTNMDVDLPKAKTIEAKSETNITITYSRDKELAINEKTIAAGRLTGELQKMIAEHPDRLVIIRADKHVPHKVILGLLSQAKKAGATHLAFATLQRNRNEA